MKKYKQERSDYMKYIGETKCLQCGRTLKAKRNVPYAVEVEGINHTLYITKSDGDFVEGYCNDCGTKNTIALKEV